MQLSLPAGFCRKTHCRISRRQTDSTPKWLRASARTLDNNHEVDEFRKVSHMFDDGSEDRGKDVTLTLRGPAEAGRHRILARGLRLGPIREFR